MPTQEPDEDTTVRPLPRLMILSHKLKKVAKTKIIFVSNWNSWRKLTYKKANKQNWSKKQIR